jgi:hypothetical protein
MTDKNEGVGKDAGRPGENAGQKRPHATLDLKATEIKDEPAQDPAKAAPETTAKASASASSSSAKREDAAPTGKPATGGIPPRPTSNPSKASAFFTHLAAGIVGGALALLGSELMSTQTAYNSLDTASLKVRAGELEERVSTLEKAPKPAAQDPELAKKLGDAEGRLAKLEETAGAIPALREAQEKQAAETKGLADKVARESADTADQDRIGKLEERLNMLAAADTGPEGGRLPQLAAITGKIADLEASLGAQITALRKSLPADIGDRLTEVDEESEAAKSATQRFDRELAAVRTEAARIGQRVEASKAESERHTAAFEAIQEDARKLNAALGELKNSVGAELKGVAKPADVSAAIAPVASKVAALEQGLQSVVKSEEGRNANAERIVLSLELGNLKRAIDSGRPYAPELERVRKAADGSMDLSALDRYKDTGVPSLPDLERAFRPVMNGIIDAAAEPAEGSVVDRLIAGARSVVRVRKVSHSDEDQSAEAVVARIGAALKEGRLGEVIEQAKAIPPQAAGPADEWLQAVKARYGVDQAIAGVEGELKASLTGAKTSPPAADAAKPAAKDKN